MPFWERENWQKWMARSFTILSVLLVVGCGSVEDRQDRAVNLFTGLSESASGSVTEVKGTVESFLDMGKSMTEGFMDLMDSTKQRVDKVQSGVLMLKEGKELIEEGISN